MSVRRDSDDVERGIFRGKPNDRDWMAYLLRVQRGSLGRYEGLSLGGGLVEGVGRV